jgi:hypothetical protein
MVAFIYQHGTPHAEERHTMTDTTDTTDYKALWLAHLAGKRLPVSTENSASTDRMKARIVALLEGSENPVTWTYAIKTLVGYDQKKIAVLREMILRGELDAVKDGRITLLSLPR